MTVKPWLHKSDEIIEARDHYIVIRCGGGVFSDDQAEALREDPEWELERASVHHGELLIHVQPIDRQ